jgi:hypothetical protein
MKSRKKQCWSWKAPLKAILAFETVIDGLQVLGCNCWDSLEFGRFGACLDVFLDGMAHNLFGDKVISGSVHWHKLSTRTVEASRSAGLKSAAKTCH